jgi:hypothetical protein
MELHEVAPHDSQGLLSAFKARYSDYFLLELRELLMAA